MNLTAQYKDVNALLPHEGAIILIDSLIDSGPDFVEVSVNHDRPSPFTGKNGRVPSWVGIEYMAQTIGVFSGLESKRRGLPVSIGFLLGTRKYRVFTQEFERGQQVKVKAVRTYHSEDNIVQFHCIITADGQLLAESDIKAIQPKDSESLLRSLSN